MKEEQKLKILMLEDNSDDAMMIQHVLRKDNLDFESRCVDTREEFNSAIRTFLPDVILSDHGLPQFNSREALRICMMERGFIPFILVTGTMTDEFAISILRDGADDYVLKSNLSRLPSAIRRAIKERKLERAKRDARRELRKQNEELLKVNKELDNFVYSVSHNLKGPLASMTGLLSIAQQLNNSVESSVSEVHQMMGASIHQLDETIKEIIEYSRNSRNGIDVTEIDWIGCIRASIDKLAYLEGTEKISKKIEIDAAVPFHSDQLRLEILFTNLLSNSLRYQSKDRKPFVTVTVQCNVSEAVIRVSDNGIGICEEVMPFIFNMFYRGTVESHGAGLGLFIVKEAITKLNGRINIMSCAGSNTHVTVTIPNCAVQTDHPVLSEAV